MPASHRFKGIPIKATLIQRGMTQRDLSTLLGMTLSTLNMKVLGERPFTDTEKERISKILGKPAPELFDTYTLKDNNENKQNSQEKAVNS